MRGDHHLSDAEREILRMIVRDYPGLSHGQVRLKFADKAGRPISRPTVIYYRNRSRAGDESRSYYHLTDAERATLDRICRDAGPDYSRTQIKELFTLATGRHIALSRVSRYLVETLGLPRIAGGRRGNVRQAGVDSRAAMVAGFRAARVAAVVASCPGKISPPARDPRMGRILVGLLDDAG
jgi:hypothetical protein